MKDLVAVVLAAGQGTRMYSGLPKVLHNVAGQPMLDHVIEAVEALDPARIYVVTGFMADTVRAHCGPRAVCVEQKKRLGTAHAVRQVAPQLSNFKGQVLITVGDAPLLRSQTLLELVKRRRAHQVAATVLTTNLENPHGYGRIVRNRDGTVRKIVEEKDTNVYEEDIKEINTGIYVFDCQKFLEALRRVGNKNAQHEYYLTDTIEILGRMGEEVEPMVADDPTETIGVNSRAELARAESYLRRRIALGVMEQGVTVIDPETTYIDKQVRIGRDTVIQPFTILQGRCEIGAHSQVGPHVQMIDSKVGDGCHLRFCSIDQAELGDNVTVGPYASVRPGSKVASGVRIGTFVEITRSSIGESTDILHLSYLGDATVGARTSIGTGSVTVNFDGRRRHQSLIGDDVFLGSKTSLIAPVEIEDGVRFSHNASLTGKITHTEGDPPASAGRARRAARQSDPPTGAKKPVSHPGKGKPATKPKPPKEASAPTKKR